MINRAVVDSRVEQAGVNPRDFYAWRRERTEQTDTRTLERLDTATLEQEIAAYQSHQLAVQLAREIAATNQTREIYEQAQKTGSLELLQQRLTDVVKAARSMPECADEHDVMRGRTKLQLLELILVIRNNFGVEVADYLSKTG